MNGFVTNVIDWTQTHNLYVVRRKDTGEFFKNVKSSWLKSWPKDDPRRSQWTHDLSLATQYTLKGVRPIYGSLKKDRYNVDNIEYEVIRLQVTIDGVEKMKGE